MGWSVFPNPIRNGSISHTRGLSHGDGVWSYGGVKIVRTGSLICRHADRSWTKEWDEVSQPMIKRVAKAVEKIDKLRGEYGGLSYEDIARAALVAMLEPTNDMLGAAAKAMSPGKRPTPDFVSVKEKHRIRYNAMIKEALND